MKSLTILLVILSFYISTYAQKIENITAKAIYKIESYKNNNQLVNDSCILAISKSYSYFYSLGSIAWEEKGKAMFEKETKTGNINSALSNIKSCTQCYASVFYKKYSTNTLYKIQPLIGKRYAYPIDSKVFINWVLLSDSILVNGATCYKAKGMLDTTIYTVWYAPSIPIADGPAFLKGLPGLIVEVETSSGVTMRLLNFKEKQNVFEQNVYRHSYEFTSLEQFSASQAALKEQMQSGNKVDIGNGATIQRKN